MGGRAFLVGSLWLTLALAGCASDEAARPAETPTTPYSPPTSASPPPKTTDGMPGLPPLPELPPIPGPGTFFVVLALAAVVIALARSRRA